MVQNAIEIPKPYVSLLGYQKRDLESTARFCWSCWSRQTGKSFTKGLKRVIRGIHNGRNQIMLSAGMRQSRELMEKVRMHVRAMNIAADYFQFPELINNTTYTVEQITLPRNIRLIALPANPDTARGFTGDVFLDEFGIHRDSREIWGAMFPTVMRCHGEIDIGSTPKGKQGMFYELKDNPLFDHSTVTIYDAVRDGLDVNIEELRVAMNDEELFRQEFLCEFIDELSAFLTYEMIIKCEDQDLPVPLFIRGGDDAIATVMPVVDSIPEGGDFYLGIDIGRKGDLTVLWLLERVGPALFTRAVIEIKDMRFVEQYAVLRQFMARGGIRGCAIDATGIGMPLAEAAQEEFGSYRVDSIHFGRSAQNKNGENVPVKQKMAEQLRIRVQDESIRIPASQNIRNDWHAIQRSVTTGGAVRYLADHTSIGHSDRFWAAALAVDAASDPSGPQEYQGSDRKLAFCRQGIW